MEKIKDSMIHDDHIEGKRINDRINEMRGCTIYARMSDCPY